MDLKEPTATQHMLTSERYQAPIGHAVSSKCWDKESVVYHTPSGETHLLDGLAAKILMLIQERPYTRSDLYDHLVRIQNADLLVDLGPGNSINEYLNEAIDQFLRLNLIEIMTQRQSG